MRDVISRSSNSGAGMSLIIKINGTQVSRGEEKTFDNKGTKHININRTSKKHQL